MPAWIWIAFPTSVSLSSRRPPQPRLHRLLRASNRPRPLPPRWYARVLSDPPPPIPFLPFSSLINCENVYIILRLDGRVRRSRIVIILCSQFNFGTKKFITWFYICNRSTEVGEYNSIVEPDKEGPNDIESNIP